MIKIQAVVRLRAIAPAAHSQQKHSFQLITIKISAVFLNWNWTLKQIAQRRRQKTQLNCESVSLQFIIILESVVFTIRIIQCCGHVLNWLFTFFLRRDNERERSFREHKVNTANGFSVKPIKLQPKLCLFTTRMNLSPKHFFALFYSEKQRNQLAAFPSPIFI